MFIKVMAILQIVSSGYSLLTVSFGAAVYVPVWYRALNVLLAVAMLALSICTLVFLSRRQLPRFRLSLLSYYGAAVVSAVAGCIMFSLNQYAMLSYMRQSSPYYTSYSSSEKQAFDAMIMGMLDFVSALFIVGVLVQIGLLIAWYYYLQRSKRVAVYFDPNYVEPPPQLYPYAAPGYPYGGPAGYYGQPLYYNGYLPQGGYPPQVPQGGPPSYAGPGGYYPGGYADSPGGMPPQQPPLSQPGQVVAQQQTQAAATAQPVPPEQPQEQQDPPAGQA